MECIRKNHDLDEVDDEENEEEKSECLLKTSYEDMIKAIEKIRHGLQKNVADDVFNSLQRWELFYGKYESASEVQQKIADYFWA